MCEGRKGLLQPDMSNMLFALGGAGGKHVIEG